ncbi:MAG: hypothetical protein WBK77_00105 [Alphaproteobacteria bacterium]
MDKSTHHNETTKTATGEFRSVDAAILSKIVSAFNPEEVGLSKAWEEFYIACQAANASHQLLRAIHDIKESIEEAEGMV